MAKQIFPEIKDLEQKKQMLIDNCDAVEEMSYHKSFDTDELLKRKEDLANTAIKIQNLEEELQEYKDHYKELLKPLREDQKTLVSELRQKGQMVTEKCYKMIDQEEKIAEYYNAEGELIMTRPATRDEMQPTIFSLQRKEA